MCLNDFSIHRVKLASLKAISHMNCDAYGLVSKGSGCVCDSINIIAVEVYIMWHKNPSLAPHILTCMRDVNYTIV